MEHRLTTLTALLLAAVGCTGPLVESVAVLSCPAFAPQGATSYEPFSSVVTPRLAGEFDLVSVVASDGPPGHSWSGVLSLVATDSVFRPLARAPGANAPWLAGTLTTWVSDRQDSVLNHDTVQVENDRMYVGCRRCLDASPLEYRIIAVTDHEFWGYWVDAQTGFDRAFDASGRRVPNPAGQYCARRRAGA
jgi:hypothetical protein